MYSLWRNNVQLGRLLHVTEESLDGTEPAGFSGILLPLVSLDDVGTVKQTRFADMPGAPVVQEYPEPAREVTAAELGMHIYPLPAHFRLDKDGKGVPQDQIFSVQLDDGTDVPSYVIGIIRQDIEPGPETTAELRAAGFPEDSRFFLQVALIHEDAYPPKWMRERYEGLSGDDS